jgi:multidrug resistance efflux pump
MINSLRLPSLPSHVKRRFALDAFALLLLAVFFSGACRSRESVDSSESAARGIIVINAPAAGEVRRVLVQEGVSVNKDAPIVEIAVRIEAPNTPQPQAEDPQARAARNIQASKTEVEAARAEVVRTEVEVQRLTPLVASGQAEQAELDGARALYERAQQRFQKAQESAQAAQSGLVAARSAPQSSSNTPALPSEQIVVVRATSAGTVRVVNAQVGERVAAGQPLATLRAD